MWKNKYITAVPSLAIDPRLVSNSRRGGFTWSSQLHNDRKCRVIGYALRGATVKQSLDHFWMTIVLDHDMLLWRRVGTSCLICVPFEAEYQRSCFLPPSSLQGIAVTGIIWRSLKWAPSVNLSMDSRALCLFPRLLSTNLLSVPAIVSFVLVPFLYYAVVIIGMFLVAVY